MPEPATGCSSRPTSADPPPSTTPSPSSPSPTPTRTSATIRRCSARSAPVRSSPPTSPPERPRLRDVGSVGEAADALAEDLGPEQEEQDHHDNRDVLGHEVLDAVQRARRLLRGDDVEQDRPGDGHRT